MKKTILLCLLCVSSLILIAQNSGITFEKGDWQTTLEKAKTENKLIFLDAYASWCGPCKKMAKDIFPLENVAAFYNENFINVKMDMEKGEGPALAEKYGLQAYPTLYFIDGNGEVMHKALGYHDADELVALGTAAMDNENNLGAYNRRYTAGGERSPEFLKKYSEVLSEAVDKKASDIAAEYLATQEDWSTSENAMYIVKMAGDDPNSDLFKYMAKNRDNLMPHVDTDMMDRKLKFGTMRHIRDAELNEEDTKAYYKNVFKADGDQFYQEYLLRKYSRMEDDDMTKKYFATARSYFSSYDIKDWQILNRVAWSVFENSDDKSILKNAVEWTRTSIAINENYANMDTLAALWYKLGNKKQALETANRAIELAKDSEYDYSATVKLLEQIKAL